MSRGRPGLCKENGVKVQRLEGVSTEGTEGDLEELETVFKDLTLPHSRRELFLEYAETPACRS